MQPLEINDADLMRVAIQQEILRSQDSRYDHRLHGVLLVCQGMDCYEVADCLGQDPVTVQRWIHQFNAHGFAGLKRGIVPGALSNSSARNQEAANAPAPIAPRPRLYPKPLDGKLLSYHLDQRFEIAWAFASASAYSEAWASASVNHAPKATEAIRWPRPHIKKLHRLARDPNLDLWSLDECHFQQHGTRCVMWVPPRTRTQPCYKLPPGAPWPCLGP